MSESNTPEPIESVKEPERPNTFTGTFGLIITLGGIALFVMDRIISEAAPCWYFAAQLGLSLLALPSPCGVSGGIGQRILHGLIYAAIAPIPLGLVTLTISIIIMRDAVRNRESPFLDSSAVAQLRTINPAEVTYYSNANNFGSVDDLIGEGLLDSRFTSSVGGYKFTVAPKANDCTG
jgi:hypothetical protein